MPTKKETTVKKKAPAKKAATKKPAVKKPAAKKPAPKKFSPVTVYLLTNGGESTISLTTKKMHDAAMKIIKAAPASSRGRRNLQFIHIEHADGTLRFKTVKKYEVVS